MLYPMSIDSSSSAVSVDGTAVTPENEAIRNKLQTYAQTLTNYGLEHNCYYDGGVSLGVFSASGTMSKGSYTGMNGNKVKYIKADFNDSEALAKKLSLPKNWKSNCK